MPDDLTQADLAEPAELLLKDIDAWVDREIEEDLECVPDFWDELQVSERLAAYLTSIGWSKR